MVVRPLSTPSDGGFDATTTTAVPLDHGLGERVQPDRQVLLPVRQVSTRICRPVQLERQLRLFRVGENPPATGEYHRATPWSPCSTGPSQKDEHRPKPSAAQRTWRPSPSMGPFAVPTMPRRPSSKVVRKAGRQPPTEHHQVQLKGSVGFSKKSYPVKHEVT